MARPRIKIDESLLEKLAKLHLSEKVIADCLGISADTLKRRYADKIENFRSRTKSKMAEVLFDEALNKRSPWAIKLLVQRHLGYFENMTKELVDASKAPIEIKLAYSDKDIRPRDPKDG